MIALVILENEAQLVALNLKNIDSLTKLILILPVTPFALSACHKKKIPFVDSIDAIPEKGIVCYEYFPERFIEEKIFFEARADFEKDFGVFINSVNDISRKVGMEHVGFPIEIGTYVSVYMYVALNHAFFSAFLLQRFLELLIPQEIIVFRPKSRPVLIHQFIKNPFDSLFYELLEHSKWKSITTVYQFKVPNNALTLMEYIKSQIQKSPRIFRAIKNTFRIMRGKTRKTRNYVSGGKNALFLGPLYNWNYIVNTHEFSERYSPLYLEPNIQDSIGYSTNQSVFSVHDFSLTCGHFSIVPVIRRQLKAMDSLFNYCVASYSKYNKFAEKIDVVLRSYLTDPIQFFLAHLLFHQEKPACLWIHGEKGICLSLSDVFEHLSDYTYTQVLLTFGPSMSTYFENIRRCSPLGPGKSEIISVGSIDMNEIIDSESDYVVFPLNKLTLNDGFSESILICDNRRFAIQKSIISYLSSQIHAKVVVKTNPTRFFTETPLDLSGVDVGDSSTSLLTLFSNAKAIIMEAAHGQTCIQACMTKKPLFFLNLHIPLLDDAKRLLERRAVIADSLPELLEKLDLFLETGQYPADLNDESFLKAYCISKDPQIVVNEVIEVLDRAGRQKLDKAISGKLL